MKTAIGIIVFAFGMSVGGGVSSAADFKIQRSVTVLSAPRAITRIRVHRRSTVANYGTKTIGMPCMLMPHVIVSYNWNGPQCRYVDNIIVPYRTVRYVR